MKDNKHFKYLRAAGALLMAMLLAACGGQTPGASSLPVSSAPPVPSSVSQPQSLPPAQPVEYRVRFSAVGDNLIHSAVYTSAQQHAGGEGYDFSYCYENVTDFFSQFDVNWLNQETIVNDVFSATAPTAPNYALYFSTPGQLGHDLYDAGWRVFALSNNHTYDMGSEGISGTLRFWESMPEDVVTTGLFTSREDDSGIGIHEVNGVKIAYVAFTETTNGNPPPSNLEAFVVYTSDSLYNTPDRAAMEFKIRRAKELADVVVVGVHWGVEYSHTATAAQKALAADFAAWGADVIIGTHPHVIQEVEWITNEADGRRVPVAYSLGNFLSAQNKPERMVGLALTLDMVKVVDPDGTIHPTRVENVKVYPVITQYEYHGGQFYSDSRTYMYSDYTDDLAAQHAVPGGISRAYIKELLETYISDEFLVLD